MTQIMGTRAMTPERVLQKLRKDIITGVLTKDGRIVEADLAERYAVSRGSVRSALQMLEGEGMIRILPNGRKEIIGFGVKEARDMYELRWMNENRAAQIILERGTMQFRPLLEVMEEIERADAARSPETDWFAMDLRFHHAVVETAGSTPLLKAWEISMPTMYALLDLNTSIDYRERYVDEFLGKHRQIVELLIKADPGIYPLLRTHIMDGNDIAANVIRYYQGIKAQNGLNDNRKGISS